MSTLDIEIAIQNYLKEKQSDYAIMLSGEWGAGKTYFVKDKISPFLKNNNKREVYVSLIGVDSDEQLEKKVFEKINPFYNQGKSRAAKESEFLESLVNKVEVKSKNKIPKNVVLVFDDLERIDSDYFESAMGFINTFIEHSNTKCIFICNEQKLESKISAYKKIKEKYIRFTYTFLADFNQLLTNKLYRIRGAQNIRLDEVLHVFNKGKCYNLRTLYFALFIFERVINSFKEEKIHFKEYKEEIIQLILNYICFYSIEYKNYSVSYRVLNQITIAYEVVSNRDVPKDINDSFFDVFNDNTKDDKEIERDDSLIIDIKYIQKKYFGKDTINFQYFESVANYIVNGFLDVDKLELDIKHAIVVLQDVSLKEKKDYINNIFTLKNNDYISEINKMIKWAENGEIDLISYVSLYHSLVTIEKYNLRGFDDIKVLKGKICNGVDLAFKRGKLIHVQQLENQLYSNYPINNYHDESKNFIDWIILTNDKLQEGKGANEIENMLNHIREKKKNSLHTLLSNKKKLILRSINAYSVYTLLKESDTDIINTFTRALYDRYIERLSDNTFSPTRENEMSFITELYKLLQDTSFLEIGSMKKMSHVQLYYLKINLSIYIEDEKKK